MSLWPVSPRDLERLRASAEFDAAWYAATHPDVVTSGLDPAIHYLRYGFRLGRDPGPGYSTKFHSTAFASVVKGREPLTALEAHRQDLGKAPVADPGRVLCAAHLDARAGNHQRALRLATRYLEVDERHTLHILKANAALWQGDIPGWLAGVNAYLAHFSMPPLELKGTGPTLYDRLTASAEPKRTDGPLVSVLMPVWNAEATLETALRSILGQSWANLEVIAVDDASTDASWSILRRMAYEDPRLRIRRNPVNVGAYVCRNLALDMAGGDWITVQDADDWAHPGRLEQHMVVVLAGHRPIPASLTYMVRMTPQGWFDMITSSNPFSPDGVTRICSASALFESAFLRTRLGYWDSVRVGADSEMIARAKKVIGEEFRAIPQLGMICLSTGRGLTQDPVLGVRQNGRLSDPRAAYRASWSAVHDTCDPAQLYLPFPQETRRYQGDFGFDVPGTDIQAVCNTAPQS